MWNPLHRLSTTSLNEKKNIMKNMETKKNKTSIIPKDEWQAKITEVFYKEPKHTMSRDALYTAVRQYGITRSYVDKFIRSQPDWQILQRAPKPKETPTIMRFEPGYVQIDTIDIKNLNSEHANYLLTCVDVFTRKIWAYPLLSNTSSEVSQQLKKFINSYKIVKTIQSDNGHEFKGEVIELLKSNNIKNVKSLPATPTSQSYVERNNGTLKRALYGYKQKTGEDPIPNLNSFVDSLNLQPNSTTGVAPAISMLEEYREQIIENMQKYNSKKNDQGNTKILEPGEKVRVRLEKTDIPADMRNKIKKQKGYLPRWSSEVYKIKQRFEAKSTWALPSYTLDTHDNLKNKRFRRSDLLKVSEDTKIEKHIPKSQNIAEYAEDDELDEYIKNNNRRDMKGPSGLEESDLYRFNNETKIKQAHDRDMRLLRRNNKK